MGQYRDRKIHQIDPQTGAILRTIESNRFVTGVTWIDGELWHGTWEGENRPPTQARLRGRQQLRDPRRLHEQVIEATAWQPLAQILLLIAILFSHYCVSFEHGKR